jgi:hypothetical protein
MTVLARRQRHQSLRETSEAHPYRLVKKNETDVCPARSLLEGGFSEVIAPGTAQVFPVGAITRELAR